MPDTDVPPHDDPARIGASYAALVGDKTWEVDAPEGAVPSSEVEAVQESPPTAVGGESLSQPEPRRPQSAGFAGAAATETPPTPEQIVEALLFAGGPPLKPERAGEIVRGLSPEQFRECVEALNRRYRAQNRPYAIVGGEQGYALAVKGRYRPVRERLFGGPREARLSQPALDVLAAVAYRQPVTRAEVDSLRGADSGAALRQLVRLGLVAVTQRGEAGQRDVSYGTTPRFLEVFGLRSLDDLPRTGDPQRL